MKDLFGETVAGIEEFTLFQDEADCKDSNYFYHGFLLVNNKSGRQILDDLLKAKGEKSRNSEITFKEIRKEDYRVKIALEWLSLADKWLREGVIRFYVLGINKNNLKNFWENSWRYDKNVYLRFFEIGLNGAVAWFKNDRTLSKPLAVSHIFFEHGPYNDERQDKIIWLEKLGSCKQAMPVYSNPKRQMEANPKLSEISNLVQLTDILLGATKYSFVRVNPGHTGKQKCVNAFIEIVERFCGKNCYNPNSSYYKRYALNFFPTMSSITKEGFLAGDLESFRKRGSFYNSRKTYRQTLAERQLQPLF